MKDWKDDIIDFMNKNDDTYFTAEWLSNHFNKTKIEIEDLIDTLESLEMIYRERLYINLENCVVYRVN